MRTRTLVALTALPPAVVLGVVGGALAAPAAAPRAAAAAAPAQVAKAGTLSPEAKRGQYLIGVMGCGDCHTPVVFDPELKMPVPDLSRMLSGHPAGGPDPGGTVGAQDIGLIGPTFTSFKMGFGTVYASNITPDKETGIGTWTVELFMKTMRTGRHLGDGRAVLPPMPIAWPVAGHATDEDLKALFAGLMSLRPIRNVVPANKVPSAVNDGMIKSYEKLLQRMAPRP